MREETPREREGERNIRWEVRGGEWGVKVEGRGNNDPGKDGGSREEKNALEMGREVGYEEMMIQEKDYTRNQMRG